jgi:hypothetical protein
MVIKPVGPGTTVGQVKATLISNAANFAGMCAAEEARTHAEERVVAP